MERARALTQLVLECERELPMLSRPAVEGFAALFGEEGESQPFALPETLGGRYRLGRELGRGGMARVYVAHDSKHDRDVAVKVIRPEVAAALGRARFLREIAIASRLRHPNIVPLFDSGDADGLLYFVMPFEDGPSLRDRLRARLGSRHDLQQEQEQEQRQEQQQGQQQGAHDLPVAECIGILRDVARALAYAHDRGVVHRDIKPDNIMLAGGAAIVTDFGIAKAVSLALVDASTDLPSAGGGHDRSHGGTPGTTGSLAAVITQSGAGIGTPAYMAPEQAIGDPSVDHRADLYSFGCVAYELFAEHPPFHGRPVHQIIAAHVAETPVPLASLCPLIPVAVTDLVTRCLAKDPRARPQHASELIAVLEQDLGGVLMHPSPPVSLPGRRTPGVPTRRVQVGAFVLLLVLTGGAAMLTRDRAAVPPPASDAELTVAVLPFFTASTDTTQRELADGLSLEVANALVRVPGLRVMSRRGANNYRGQTDIDPVVAGQQLGAGALVTGRLAATTGKPRLVVSLVDATDRRVLWSDAYDWKPDSLAGVRDHIVREIEIAMQRGPGRSARLPNRSLPAARPAKGDASWTFLLAQRDLDRRGQSLRRGTELFREATRLDSTFARAYSGLSLSLALTPYFEVTPWASISDEATRSARRALLLDSTLAQPHIALGLIHQLAYQWDDAESEFQQAIRRDGRDIEARVQYGRHLLFRGRLADALAEFRTAGNEDPASALVSAWVSYTYFLTGQPDSASIESGRAFQSDSTNLPTLALGALVHLNGGRSSAARDLVRRMPPVHPVTLFVLARTGDTTTAMDRVRDIGREPKPRPMRETARAYAYLGAGDTAQALLAFERATDTKEPWPSLQPVGDPLFHSIRSSPRFQQLLRRVGLRCSGC
ncbi:MAG: protein kinase [Gemmatimonadota bacterium]